MNVLLNELPNLPHHEGQEVLKVRDRDYELTCSREGAGCWLYMFVLNGGKKMYARMVRPAATAEDARREA
jgi:hypothetical protein